MQLLVKGLLKPFYSVGSIETSDETEYGDDGMLALEPIDDEEEEHVGDPDAGDDGMLALEPIDDEEEECVGDPDAGDDDMEEEEDPLGALDDDERE
jgi:hypothetical protein